MKQVTSIFLTSFIFIFANKKRVTVLMMLPGLNSETSTSSKNTALNKIILAADIIKSQFYNNYVSIMWL